MTTLPLPLPGLNGTLAAAAERIEAWSARGEVETLDEALDGMGEEVQLLAFTLREVPTKDLRAEMVESLDRLKAHLATAHLATARLKVQ